MDKTQKIQHTLRVLQMDNAQLNEYLTGKMMENPMIEMETASADDSKMKVFERKMQWLERQTEKEAEQSVYFSQDLSRPAKKPSWPSETVSECLLHQLGDGDELTKKLIGYLDDNGYFTLPLSELAQEAGCSQEEAEAAVETICSFQPTGVGAFTLSECLTMQLPKDAALARKIAKHHLAQLSSHDWETIAQKENVSTEQVCAAAKQLWACSPRPGSACGREELPFYWTPDLLIVKFQDRYEVMLCEFNLPQLRVCQDYIDMAHEENDPALTQYIQSNLDEMKWLKQSVAARGETLLKVARAVFQLQERFLRYGPQYLRLVTCEEIAVGLGIQEKIVRYALKNKYMQCPYGVFPMSYFVLMDHDDKTQEHINRNVVKNAIQEILVQEREEAPYSDHKLMQILNSRGYPVSSRMVQLYREELGIADAHSRLNLNMTEEECSSRLHEHHHDEEDECSCGHHHHDEEDCSCGHHHC